MNKPLTDKEYQIVKDSNERLIKAIKDWKLNPNKYMTPKYITKGGDKIAVIDEVFLDNGNGVVTGVIVDSPTKIFIGFTNTFQYPREITKI